MNKQPEALRLAAILMSRAAMTTDQRVSTADELRRLHAENEALLEALTLCAPYVNTYSTEGYDAEAKARAVISKCKGDKDE